MTGGTGFAISSGLFSLGLGQGGWGGSMERNAGKPELDKAAVTVTVVNRLLGYLRPVILVGIILVLCMAIYAVGLALIKQ